MWTHYCCAEHEVLSVGEGEECNWCGTTEEQSQKLVTENTND